VLGPVTLSGLNEGTRDLSKQKWSYKVCHLPLFCPVATLKGFIIMIRVYHHRNKPLLSAFCLQIGLKGEALNLNTVSGSSSVEWVQGSSLAKKQPLTWYKVRLSFNKCCIFMSVMT